MAGGRAANAVLRFPARAFRRGGTAARRGGTAARWQLNTAVGGPARVRAVVLLACVLALASADTATVGAAAAPLRHALGISNTDIGLLVTVTALVGAVFSLPFGVLADRLRRTWILGFALLTWGAAMLWSATASSFGQLLLTRACLGAVTAAAGPVVASLVGDWFPGAERGRIYGFVLTGELVGAGVGFAVTGDIAALSWRARHRRATGNGDRSSACQAAVARSAEPGPQQGNTARSPADRARAPGHGVHRVDTVRAGGADQRRADHLQRLRILLPDRSADLRHRIRQRAVPRHPGVRQPAPARRRRRGGDRGPGRRPAERRDAQARAPGRADHGRGDRRDGHHRAVHPGAGHAQHSDRPPVRGPGGRGPVRAEPADRRRPAGHHAVLVVGPCRGHPDIPAHRRPGPGARPVRRGLRSVRGRYLGPAQHLRDHAAPVGGLRLLPLPRPSLLPLRPGHRRPAQRRMTEPWCVPSLTRPVRRLWRSGRGHRRSRYRLPSSPPPRVVRAVPRA